MSCLITPHFPHTTQDFRPTEISLRPPSRHCPDDMITDSYHSRSTLDDFPTSNVTVPHPCPAALKLSLSDVASTSNSTRQLSTASTLPAALLFSAPIKPNKAARKAKDEMHACKACLGTFRHQDDLEVHRRSNPICSAHIHDPQYHDSGTMNARSPERQITGVKRRRLMNIPSWVMNGQNSKTSSIQKCDTIHSYNYNYDYDYQAPTNLSLVIHVPDPMHSPSPPPIALSDRAEPSDIDIDITPNKEIGSDDSELSTARTHTRTTANSSIFSSHNLDDSTGTSIDSHPPWACTQLEPQFSAYQHSWSGLPSKQIADSVPHNSNSNSNNTPRPADAASSLLLFDRETDGTQKQPAQLDSLEQSSGSKTSTYPDTLGLVRQHSHDSHIHDDDDDEPLPKQKHRRRPRTPTPPPPFRPQVQVQIQWSHNPILSRSPNPNPNASSRDPIMTGPITLLDPLFEFDAMLRALPEC